MSFSLINLYFPAVNSIMLWKNWCLYLPSPPSRDMPGDGATRKKIRSFSQSKSFRGLRV